MYEIWTLDATGPSLGAATLTMNSVNVGLDNLQAVARQIDLVAKPFITVCSDGALGLDWHVSYSSGRSELRVRG
jgi:hypothetical protein